MTKPDENGWLPIDEWAKGYGLVRLRCDAHPEWGEHLMFWSHRMQRWEGRAFTPMLTCGIWWDEHLPQPTHYRPVTP